MPETYEELCGYVPCFSNVWLLICPTEKEGSLVRSLSILGCGLTLTMSRFAFEVLTYASDSSLQTEVHESDRRGQRLPWQQQLSWRPNSLWKPLRNKSRSALVFSLLGQVPPRLLVPKMCCLRSYCVRTCCRPMLCWKPPMPLSWCCLSKKRTTRSICLAC